MPVCLRFFLLALAFSSCEVVFNDDPKVSHEPIPVQELPLSEKLQIKEENLPEVHEELPLKNSQLIFTTYYLPKK